jgi:hypothetical protein
MAMIALPMGFFQLPSIRGCGSAAVSARSATRATDRITSLFRS